MGYRNILRYKGGVFKGLPFIIAYKISVMDDKRTNCEQKSIVSQG